MSLELQEAVNVDEINSICNRIFDHVDNILAIFDKIDLQYTDVISELDICLSADIIAIYKNIKKNYLTIQKNWLSYSTDLSNLVSIMSEGTKSIANVIDRETTNLNVEKGEV